ncbi:4Fe-4S binding protein [Carboxydothermus islandicus]|uniref:4Fe-4S binding protein n=1 Tax=Carboxydothermus islandicus TaxID=661089 RepID=UPI001412C758|nr:4Fe-4S binding protein [Carboxydothermus islandicus]
MLRKFSQYYYLFFFSAAGFFFYRAVTLFPTEGVSALKYRFPSIEGFLPISALVALKSYLFTGIFDPVHPAGLTILILIILSAFLFKRGFCSHICPIGTVSELLYRLRKKIIPGDLIIPTWLGYFLASTKYLIALFFIKVILIDMPYDAAWQFVHSPYNAVADIKMLKFFLNPSALTVKVLLVLIILSLTFPQFWCRFLCPYGAFMNIFAFFSPLTLKRNNESCISCKKCDKICPGNLKISTQNAITSPECTLCYSCVEVCPVKNTLSIGSRIGKFTLTPFQYSLLLLGFFIGGMIIAKLTGHWHSTVLPELWQAYYPLVDMLSH